ncbi:hypothetical protein HanPI659440_Chr08g0290101 [Helianthus annuus]|nr:hypothetical protein HanPI659440_Chr08g0290101 [Helianthus annuus]
MAVTLIFISFVLRRLRRRMMVLVYRKMMMKIKINMCQFSWKHQIDTMVDYHDMVVEMEDIFK